MRAYIEQKAGPFAAAPTSTGFSSLDMVQPGFTDAKKHAQALVSEYARIHPGADPAGRDILLARQLLDPNEAVCQTIMLPMGANTSTPENSSHLFVNEEPGMWCTVGACSTRPLSRGHVHINSSDPTVQPIIDPAYYKHPLDLDIIARSILHVIELAQVEPLRSVLRRDENGEVLLRKTCGNRLPKTLEEAKDFARNNSVTMYHPVGTCGMLPREKGGVVSDELRVYGTSNVRVVDASIFPTNVQGNIVSLVYAVAEKGADIIKATKSK